MLAARMGHEDGQAQTPAHRDAVVVVWQRFLWASWRLQEPSGSRAPGGEQSGTSVARQGEVLCKFFVRVLAAVGEQFGVV